MTINTQTKPWLRLCTGVLAAGGVALSTFGLASGTAQAAPSPSPTYHHHWCPGDQWDNGWGNNPDWNHCRDWDDNYNGGGYHHHWCPGDQWDNRWGNNPDWNHCRDWDDNR